MESWINWDNFLTIKSDEFELSAAEKKSFKLQFKKENFDKSLEKLIDFPSTPTLENHQKQMTKVYDKFAQKYPKVDLGVHKSKPLQQWLEEQYHQFVTSTNCQDTHELTPKSPLSVQHLQGEFTTLIERPQEIEQIVNHLINEQRKPSQNIIVLWGAGGCGKTALALLTCCELEIVQHFSGGIFWVDLKEENTVLEGMKDLYYQLTGSEYTLADPSFIVHKLQRKWTDKPCLIVLDNVQETADLNSFYRINSEHYTWLITTRNKNICVPRNSIEIQVNSLRFDESIELIYYDLHNKGNVALDKVKELVSQLYEWPLLVDLVRKEIHRKIKLNYTPNKALETLIGEIKRNGWTFFMNEITESFRSSFKCLSQKEQECFKELVIFPESVPIPLGILEKLWDLKNIETFCENLYSLSLLQLYDPNNQRICLNPIFRKVLIQQPEINENLSKIHHKLIKTYEETYSIQSQEDCPDELLHVISDEEKIYLQQYYQRHKNRAN